MRAARCRLRHCHSGRNLLGVEWVLPTGEVLTLGSAGAGAGWFTADGPGPSLRGIMRGFQGTFGGLGVFTKCAVKLYKWNGPATWGVQGKSPVYLLDRLPDRMAFNVHAFPSAQAMKDAGYKLGEAEIEYACFRTPMFFTALGMTENNEQLKVALESGVFHKVMHHVLVNSVIGHSAGEFKWKMAAMKQIMKETGGVRIPMYLKITPGVLRVAGPLLKPLKDPLWPLRRFPFLQDVIHSIPIGKEQKLVQDSRLFWLLVRNAVNTQATFRPSQGMSTMLGSFDTWDMGLTQSEWIAGLMAGETFEARDFDPCFLFVGPGSCSGWVTGGLSGSGGTWDGHTLVWTGHQSSFFDGFDYTITARVIPEPGSLSLMLLVLPLMFFTLGGRNRALKGPH